MKIKNIIRTLGVAALTFTPIFPQEIYAEERDLAVDQDTSNSPNSQNQPQRDLKYDLENRIDILSFIDFSGFNYFRDKVLDDYYLPETKDWKYTSSLSSNSSDSVVEVYEERIRVEAYLARSVEDARMVESGFLNIVKNLPSVYAVSTLLNVGDHATGNVCYVAIYNIPNESNKDIIDESMLVDLIDKLDGIYNFSGIILLPHGGFDDGSK